MASSSFPPGQHKAKAVVGFGKSGLISRAFWNWAMASSTLPLGGQGVAQ